MKYILKITVRIMILSGIIIGSLGLPSVTVFAAPELTVTPITWNVIGLDSNDETTGPDNFPVAVRVCNDSLTDDATNVTAAFVWDDGEDLYNGHSFINLRNGSLSSITYPGVLGAGGACTDFYFEATVKRDPGAYNQTRSYHIEISSDEGATAASPQPRELFVEYLVSQSRNSTNDFALDGDFIPAGGGMALVVGQEYQIDLYGSTATNGYEQLETFINFPNTIFQILSVSTEYDADSTRVPSPNDKLYSDSCLWENDPGDLEYLSCLDVGKNGGDILVTYQIKIIGGAGSTQTLTSLIYDFSGSSFHYNADFSASARIAHIIDPSSVTITKEFIPDPTSVGGSSTLNFSIFNPNGVTLDQLSFRDIFPTSPGAMVTADPAAYSSSGCGTPSLEAPIGAGSFQAGQPSLAASGLSVGPNGTCTLSVQVTAPTAGTYDNQTSNLLVGDVDTGNYAEASLTADDSTYPPPAGCTPGTVMAYWDLDASLLPTYQSGLASSVSASYSGDLISTVPYSYVGQNGWGLTSGVETWPQDPAAPPGYPLYGASPYFEFSIDSSNFSDAQLVFDIGLDGNWADAADNHVFIWSEADGGGYGATPAYDVNPISQSPAQWYPGVTVNATTTGSSTTSFRINEIGAKQTGTDPAVVLDNVYILGCGLPDYPTISKSFAPDPVAVGGTSTLSFSIENPNQFTDLSGISFSDILPDGLTVPTSGPISTCGGSLATTAPDTITFSGGSLLAGTACSLSGITITAATAGPHTNISGFISSSETGVNTGPGGSATASLTAILPPQIAKDFSPDPVVLTGSTALSTLTFTITNPNQDYALTGVSFTDVFPTSPGSMVVAPDPNQSTADCGTPTFDTTPGAGLVTFADGTIAPGGACTVSVDISAPAAGGTAVPYSNLTGTVADEIAGVGNSATDDLVVLPPTPEISLLKQVSKTDSGPWSQSLGVNIGDPVYYRFVIENIGDVSFSPISVSDPTLAGLGLDPASCVWPLSLPAPTAANDDHIATCIVGPISAVVGDIDNTATAQGTYGGVVYHSDPSTARYKTYGLTLDKTADEAVYTAAGDSLHYNFLVTNSGYVRLASPVTINDDKASDESCPAAASVGNGDDWLDPGESITCTATYLVPGPTPPLSVTNTALATADGIESNPDSLTVTYLTPPTVTKAFVPATISVGDISLLIITLNNPGGTDLTGLAFTDTYPVGKIYNADPANGSTDCTGGTVAAVAGGGSVGLTGATLEAGGACTISVNVSSVTPGDHNNSIPIGGVTNNQGVSNTSGAADTLTVNSIAPTITKTFSPDVIFSGGTSTLTLIISNPNNAGLSNLAFSDFFPGDVVVAAAPNASSDCGGTLNAPAGAGVISLSGGSISGLGSCTISVDVTGVTGGTVTNTTSVVTSDEAPDSGRASDDLTVLVPLLSIIKTGTFIDESGDGFAQPGETISYSFTVSNEGGVSLTNVTVTDPLVTVSGGPTTLAVGETDNTTFTGTYAITQSDIDAGQFVNTATADSDESGPDSDQETTLLGQNPLLSIIKTGSFNDESGDGFAQPGETISYNFSVSNDGNLTLTNVTVTDPQVIVAGGPITLNVGETDSSTFTGTYTITQTDIDAGQFLNTARADSDESGPDSDQETTPLAQNPSLSIIKTGTLNDDDGTPGVSAGDTIDYGFAVSNEGNVTLTNVTVTDPQATVSGGPTTLDVGETDTATFTGSYTITQADIDAGQFVNTATADSDESEPDSDQETTPLAQNPELMIVKTGTFNDETNPAGIAQEGETISYELAVTNTGNQTLSNMVVSDPLVGVITCPDGNPLPSLAVGVTVTCTGTYTVNQNDIDVGQVDNTATADSDESEPDSDSETTPLSQVPSLSIIKTGTLNDDDGTPGVSAGDTIDYEFAVSNDGNITLTNVTVTDPQVTVSGGPTTLDVGDTDTTTFSGSYTITQTDIDAGQFVNTATADSDESGPDSDTETTPLAQNPLLSIIKTGTLNDDDGIPGVSAGDTIDYEFAVSNDGNVALTNVTVADPQVTVTGGPTTLDVGETDTTTFTGTYAITQTDIDAGQFVNTATADSDESGPDSDTETTPLAQNPLLSIIKTGTLNDDDGTPGVSAGDTIDYEFAVSNDGNVTLTNVTVTDPEVTVSGDPTSLDVGEINTTTFTGSYTITQADIDAGQFVNTATADSDETGPASDQETTALEQTASLMVEKSSTTTNLTAPETVNYNYLVTNTGNMTITGLDLSDDNDNDDMNCDLSVIPVGSTTTCSATHTFTQAELDAYGSPVPNSGFLSNTVIASSNEARDASDSLDIPIYRIFDPPFGVKEYDESGLPVLRWTMVWINDSNTAALTAEVYDPIPVGTTYLASGASSGYGVPGGAPAESTDVGVSCLPDLTGGDPSTTTECYYEGPTPGYPRGRIVWKGSLGPDFGATDEADAQNELVISFRVRVDDDVFTVTNNATIDADLNGDGVISEDEEFEVDSVQAIWTGDLPPVPDTGFEPGVVTQIPAQLESQVYQPLGPVWLEIPSLGVRTEIVGVPLQDGEWDVTWLSRQAGWLEGSAFPSYNGNSILTAHVYLPSGYPGPFVNLSQLSWDDRIIVHVFGEQFIYRVRSNQLIQPDDPGSVESEELPWLTLLTCKGFNPDTGTYDHRVMIKAVLMEVKPERKP